MRTILKFDTGADGFLKMIFVLIVFAILLLIIGLSFLYFLQHDLHQLSLNTISTYLV